MDIQNQIKDLQDRIEQLEQKRITQKDVIPDSIKMRHMGEGNRFIKAGVEAKRPDGAEVTDSVTYYFATDTNKLWIWNGTAWKYASLS